MTLYTLASLSNEISACGTLANRADVIDVLYTLSTNIDTLNALLARAQLNVNSSIITTVAGVKKQFDISEVVTTQTPSGSLVGDTIVAQYTGMYRINYSVSAPTTASIGADITFQIEKNVSTSLYSEMVEDNGATATTFVGEIYRRLTATDAVKFYLTTQFIVTNAGGTFTVEYLGI